MNSSMGSLNFLDDCLRDYTFFVEQHKTEYERVLMCPLLLIAKLHFSGVYM